MQRTTEPVRQSDPVEPDPIELDPLERRREPRFPIQAGATVEVTANGRVVHAITIDMSGCGVLLDFAESVPLTVGQQVICEFNVSHDADKPLPYWGVGKVVRVHECRAAIDLIAGGFCPLETAPQS